MSTGELADIVESVTTERRGQSEPLFQHKYRLPIFLAVSMGVFNQLTGINAILYYLNDIFERAGFSKVSSDQQAVVIGSPCWCSRCVAMSVIDRLGRKKLLLIGRLGPGCAWPAWPRSSPLGSTGNWLLWLLVGFIAFFSFSQGAVIWVYLSEVVRRWCAPRGRAWAVSATGS